MNTRQHIVSENVIVECDRNVTNEDILGYIDKLGLTDKLDRANYVVIKPNFAAGHQAAFDSHIVSDITLISSIAKSILTAYPEKRVYIAESDSSENAFAFLKFENLGLPESLNLEPAMAENVRLLDLSRDRLTRVKSPKFQYFKNDDVQLWLSKTLIECDFIIDMTNLKMHTVTRFTGACKNLFGVLHESEKWIFHTHIEKVIHDLTIAVVPKLSIVDSFFGMERNGPVLGDSISGGFRVWSSSSIEADIVSCETVGIKFGKVKHLKLLAKTEGKNIAMLSLPFNKVISFRPPVLFSRVSNRAGLLIQKCGESIQILGHRVHNAYNIVGLMTAIARPVLIGIFGKERLVKIKRKLKGEKK
jgi:uncharacterized protein (DUF362 family)